MSTIAWDGKLLVTDGRIIYRRDGKLDKRDREQRIYPCYLQNIKFRNKRIVAAAGDGDIVMTELVIALLTTGADVEDSATLESMGQIPVQIGNYLRKINRTKNRMVNTKLVLIGEDEFNFVLELEHVRGSTLAIKVNQLNKSELILYSEVYGKIIDGFKARRDALSAVQTAMTKSPGTGGSVIIFDPEGPHADKTRMYEPHPRIAFFNNIQWKMLKIRDFLGLIPT